MRESLKTKVVDGAGLCVALTGFAIFGSCVMVAIVATTVYDAAQSLKEKLKS